MGKNLKNTDLVLRTGKLAFYLVPGYSAYTRMEGFTSLSTSKNPTTYERQYVDEEHKRTDLTGYNVSTAYALDRYKDHPVISDIVKIHESELTGADAIRSIIQVDMTTAENTQGNVWTATGRMRNYSVIPSADGDSTDCMTYSGDFKTCGDMEEVAIITTDNFQTISLASASAKPVLTSLSLTSGTLSPAFSSTVNSYTTTKTGSISVMATAESPTFHIIGMCNGYSYSMDGKSASFSNVAVGDYIYITVDNGGSTVNSSNTYKISIISA